jgi:hypothetical protein
MRMKVVAVSGAVMALVLVGTPRPASALVFTADMTVECLSGTTTLCGQMGFLLSTDPSLVIRSFVITDTEYTRNPLTFDITGAAIYQGTSTSGTLVTSEFTVAYGVGPNVNVVRATDPAAPYDVLQPLYFVVNAGTAGDIRFLAFDVNVCGPCDGPLRQAGSVNDQDVRVVPEPTTALLFGVGLLGTAAAVRRKRSL